MNYPFDYNGKCYAGCEKGFLYDENNNKLNKCKCELDECSKCPIEALNEGLCSECNTNYYPKENDPLNKYEYIKCYKDPDGYYLDNNLYKQCYYTCKICYISGNNVTHNCIKCNDNYPIGIKNDNSLNCYENCSYYYYVDNENNFHCTQDSSCPKEYSKLNKNKKECVKYDLLKELEDLKINVINVTEKMSKVEEIEYYDNLKKAIEKEFIENYDIEKLNSGDEVIKTEKMTITFTTVENQKNNINKNVTTINLGGCEQLLRDYYNISSNEKLYMKTTEVYQEGMKIPKVEYDIYSALFGENLKKLNLKVCGNSKISISLPIKLTEKLDILNSSSGYYNDICYTTTSEDGTDISLKDRKIDFIDKNKTVCQNDCEFSKYDSENMKVECSCEIKESSSSITDMNIDKNKLLKNFKDIKNIANLNFLVCYRKLFKKVSIIYNIGSYIILVIILFHIISIFVFSAHDYFVIKKKIKKIILGMNEYQIFNKKEKVKNDKSLKAINKISIHRKDKRSKSDKVLIQHIKPKNENSKREMIPKIIKQNHNDNKHKKIKIDFLDEEINDFSYDLATHYDKRNFCQYYISLLKTKHSLFFALYNNKDYNSRIIKIDLFLIGFAIDFTVNALFFNDDTMHKIYQSKGEFDLESQIPIIIYSTLISMVLNTPLNFLSLSSDAIIAFKQYKSKINVLKRAKLLENKLKIKISLYFVIGFLLLSIFWYYIAMFCVIYKNTQLHLLKDTLMSLGFSLFIPFVIYLIPGIFRIPALSNRKSKKACLYKFSKFLQSF